MPRIFVIEMVALILTSEENDLFISCLPSSSGYDVIIKIRRRKSYANKHGKSGKVVTKTITSTNAEKNFLLRRKCPHPLNSKIKCSVPKQNKLGNNCNFYWSGYILYNFGSYLSYHFAISSFNHFVF